MAFGVRCGAAISVFDAPILLESAMMPINQVRQIRSKLLSVALASVALTATASAAKTLENLQAAYNRESNAHARYLAFAQQADKEGYGEVASLFRASARAEEIHAVNHAMVIKRLGAEPQAKLETPEVKTTRANLQAAIKGESYERDTMYPEFLKQARADRDKDAIKSLSFAKQAEEEHAKLYSAFLADLNRFRGSASRTFYVCPACGYTSRGDTLAKCPTCFTPKEKFEKVA